MFGTVAEGTRRQVAGAGIGEVLVGLVTDVVDAAPAAQLVDAAQRFGLVDNAGGIVRGNRHHHAGAIGNGCLDGVDAQAVALVGGYHDGAGIGHGDGHLVVEVEGRHDDDLVPRVAGGHDDVVESHVAASGDEQHLPVIVHLDRVAEALGHLGPGLADRRGVRGEPGRGTVPVCAAGVAR